VRRFALVLVGVACAPATAHAATPVAEIRNAHGVLVGKVGDGPYESPRDYGYLLTIGHRRDASVSRSRREHPRGRIRIASMYVPASGTAGAHIDGLQVAGRYAQATPNTVLQVGDGSYAVFLRKLRCPDASEPTSGLSACASSPAIARSSSASRAPARPESPGAGRRGCCSASRHSRRSAGRRS
jgi:hypothetical protein